jgi:hypothetical protein
VQHEAANRARVKKKTAAQHERNQGQVLRLDTSGEAGSDRRAPEEKNGKRETAEGLNQCEKNESEHTRIKSRRISYGTVAQHSMGKI